MLVAQPRPGRRLLAEIELMLVECDRLLTAIRREARMAVPQWGAVEERPLARALRHARETRLGLGDWRGVS